MLFKSNYCVAQRRALVSFVLSMIQHDRGTVIVLHPSRSVPSVCKLPLGHNSYIGVGAPHWLHTKVLDDPPPRTIDVAKLFLCIFIDILGSANEAIPLVGELVDVIYAPIAALVLRQLFAGSNIVFLLEFTEEILPFTDVLPLATICWVVEAFFGDGALARALRIGEFAPNRGDFIDVDTTRAKEKSMDNSDDEEKSKFLLQSDKRNNAKR